MRCLTQVGISTSSLLKIICGDQSFRDCRNPYISLFVNFPVVTHKPLKLCHHIILCKKVFCNIIQMSVR